MSLSITENSRVFRPQFTQTSYFHSGCVGRIALKWQKMRFVTVSASSGYVGVDEKGSQFKPSFDEYLKVMESLRDDRGRSSTSEKSELTDSEGENTSVDRVVVTKRGRDDGGVRSTKEVRNATLVKEGEDISKKEELKDSGGRSRRRRVVVMKEGRAFSGFSREKYVREGTHKGGRKIGDLSSKKYGEVENIEGRNAVSRLGIREHEKVIDTNTLRDVRNGTMMKEGGDNSIKEELRDSGGRSRRVVVMKEGRAISGFSREKYVREGTHKGGRNFGDLSSKKYGEVENVEERNVVSREHEEVIDTNTIRMEKLRKFTAQSSTDRGRIAWEDAMDMERSAFRPFKQPEDAYAQPRIARAEMEERIQKLANCLNGADINMPEWMFTKMILSTQIRFSDYSILRLIQILGKLGNWRRVLQVIEWMQLRERFKSHKLRNIYTAALDALGKARRPVEALNLFNLMQQNMSSYPDIVAYRRISVTLGQAGHMKELFSVIDTMRSPPKKKLKTGVLEKWDPRLEPDIVVYNAVLNACVERKKWEGAFWVLQQLKQQGQQPSTTTYGLAMEVMLACGKYKLVHEFFRKVQKTSIPNALTYKVLINTLWKEDKVTEALSAVQDMERRGIVGTASLYYDLARCLCSAGRCEEALLQIDKLCRVANKPLVVTYTGLIQACIDCGNIENAVYIFNHMQKFCSPNLVTYNIMLKAFLDVGKFEEAKELFLTILGNRNVMPDLYTFNVMLDSCAAEQKWEDVEFAYVNMLKYGHHFNAKRHLQVVLAACAAGKEELLEKTWKHLSHGDKVPPFLLIDAMVRVKLKEGDLVEALSCFGCHPKIETQAFSRKWWLKLLQENRFESHTLVKLIHTLNSLVIRTEAQKLIFENLKMLCEELLTSQMKFDAVKNTVGRAPSPGQTTLVN